MDMHLYNSKVSLKFMTSFFLQKGAVQKRHEENEEENEEKELLVYVSEEQRQEFSTFIDKVWMLLNFFF